MDFVGVLSPAIAAVALGFGIYQNRRAYHLARRVALAQGQLSKPDLDLRCSGYPLDTEFVIIGPLDGKRIIDYPAPFKLVNAGSKTAREIDLLLRFPKPIIFGGSDMSKFKTDLPRKEYTFRTVARSENLETRLMSVPSLNPGAKVTLDTPLPASEE